MGEVTYNKSADDYVDLNRDIFAATIRHKPVRRITRIGGAATLLAGMGWMLDRDGGTGAVFYGAAIGALIVLPVCWAIAWALLPARARKVYAQDRATDLRWTWHWSEAGIEGESANATYRRRWSELHRWHDWRRTLQFFLNEVHVLYIPRHRLTEAQADELRALADGAGVPRG